MMMMMIPWQAVLSSHKLAELHAVRLYSYNTYMWVVYIFFHFFSVQLEKERKKERRGKKMDNNKA